MAAASAHGVESVAWRRGAAWRHDNKKAAAKIVKRRSRAWRRGALAIIDKWREYREKRISWRSSLKISAAWKWKTPSHRARSKNKAKNNVRRRIAVSRRRAGVISNEEEKEGQGMVTMKNSLCGMEKKVMYWAVGNGRRRRRRRENGEKIRVWQP